MPWQKIFEQTRGDFFLVLPEAMLVFFGLAILLTDFLLTKPQKSWNALTAMLGVIFSGGSLYMLREYASPPIRAGAGILRFHQDRSVLYFLRLSFPRVHGAGDFDFGALHGN